jgi:preprotein translocase subunit YajC
MFVTPAFAQDVSAAATGSVIAQFIPLILIFGIMYFLLIRPQQKKLKDQRAMIEAVRRGDQVVTSGGIIGKVSKVKDDGEVEIEIADGVRVRVVKSTISQVLSKTEPAAAANTN